MNLLNMALSLVLFRDYVHYRLAETVGYGMSAFSFAAATLLPTICMLFITLDTSILIFRTHKGRFGNNEEEARELLGYIIQRRSDTNDGEGNYGRIFSAEDISALGAEIEAQMEGVRHARVWTGSSEQHSNLEL
jgi:hypothetical protein